MASEIFFSSDSSDSSASNGDNSPEEAGPNRYSSTVVESQHTSSLVADTLARGRKDTSKIAHRNSGFIVRMPQPPTCSANIPLFNTVAS